MTTVNQYERAYRAWPILACVAQNKKRIKYGELAKELRLRHHRPVTHVLEKIQNYCLGEKLPPLTILVENKKGVVGKGFTAWDIDDLDTGLQKVYAFDWSEVQNPFRFASEGASPEDISSALAKRTVSPEEVYAKVRVRGMGQIIFRETLLRVYVGCCAFSGYRGKSLLQAAHILPWSQSKPEERLDPSNGILLSVLHHRLFDLDWIRIDETYLILVNQNLVKKQSLSKEELALLAGLNRKAMTLPSDNRNWPSKRLIAERNKKSLTRLVE
jgi:putative restriction endonuclease